jgi:hypothetical protein
MPKHLSLSIAAAFIVGLAASPGAAQNLATFRGGIGAIPISNVLVDTTTGAITVNRNTVRGVNSPGQIWTIKDLDAHIRPDGEIRADGKALILAGGNSIGRATGQSVFASLFCGNAEHSTENVTGVPLAADGDFKIHDVLTPAPPPNCENPVLLIRTVGSGNWFAAGILKSSSAD